MTMELEDTKWDHILERHHDQKKGDCKTSVAHLLTKFRAKARAKSRAKRGRKRKASSAEQATTTAKRKRTDTKKRSQKSHKKRTVAKAGKKKKTRPKHQTSKKKLVASKKKKKKKKKKKSKSKKKPKPAVSKKRSATPKVTVHWTDALVSKRCDYVQVNPLATDSYVRLMLFQHSMDLLSRVGNTSLGVTKDTALDTRFQAFLMFGGAFSESANTPPIAKSKGFADSRDDSLEQIVHVFDTVKQPDTPPHEVVPNDQASTPLPVQPVLGLDAQGKPPEAPIEKQGEHLFENWDARMIERQDEKGCDWNQVTQNNSIVDDESAKTPPSNPWIKPVDAVNSFSMFDPSFSGFLVTPPQEFNCDEIAILDKSFSASAADQILQDHLRCSNDTPSPSEDGQPANVFDEFDTFIDDIEIPDDFNLAEAFSTNLSEEDTAARAPVGPPLPASQLPVGDIPRRCLKPIEETKESATYCKWIYTVSEFVEAWKELIEKTKTPTRHKLFNAVLESRQPFARHDLRTTQCFSTLRTMVTATESISAPYSTRKRMLTALLEWWVLIHVALFSKAYQILEDSNNDNCAPEAQGSLSQPPLLSSFEKHELQEIKSVRDDVDASIQTLDPLAPVILIQTNKEVRHTHMRSLATFLDFEAHAPASSKAPSSSSSKAAAGTKKRKKETLGDRLIDSFKRVSGVDELLHKIAFDDDNIHEQAREEYMRLRMSLITFAIMAIEPGPRSKKSAFRVDKTLLESTLRMMRKSSPLPCHSGFSVSSLYVFSKDSVGSQKALWFDCALEKSGLVSTLEVGILDRAMQPSGFVYAQKNPQIYKKIDVHSEPINIMQTVCVAYSEEKKAFTYLLQAGAAMKLVFGNDASRIPLETWQRVFCMFCVPLAHRDFKERPRAFEVWAPSWKWSWAVALFVHAFVCSLDMRSIWEILHKILRKMHKTSQKHNKDPNVTLARCMVQSIIRNKRCLSWEVTAHNNNTSSSFRKVFGVNTSLVRGPVVVKPEFPDESSPLTKARESLPGKHTTVGFKEFRAHLDWSVAPTLLAELCFETLAPGIEFMPDTRANEKNLTKVVETQFISMSWFLEECDLLAKTPSAVKWLEKLRM